MKDAKASGASWGICRIHFPASKSVDDRWRSQGKGAYQMSNTGNRFYGSVLAAWIRIYKGFMDVCRSEGETRKCIGEEKEKRKEKRFTHMRSATWPRMRCVGIWWHILLRSSIGLVGPSTSKYIPYLGKMGHIPLETGGFAIVFQGGEGLMAHGFLRSSTRQNE